MMWVPTLKSVSFYFSGAFVRPIVSFVLFSCVFGSPAAHGEVLQGIAAGIQAVSPIVTAGIQASTNTAIAGINSATSIATAQIASATAKFLSTNQRDVALAQTQAAVNMNAMNQQAVTDRLGMQLNELRDARNQQFETDRMRMNIEKELNQARIDLAYKQAAANKTLAEMTLKTQLVQAGLSTGFKRRDSGSSLAVTTNLTGGARSQVAGVASTQTSASTRPSGTAMTTRLLASASSSGGGRFPSLSVARRSALGSQQAGALVSSLSQNRNLRGSAPGSLARLEGSPVPQSDLRSFRQSVGVVSVGRRRTSTVEGSHSARGVTGRPVSGKRSSRPRTN